MSSIQRRKITKPICHQVALIRDAWGYWLIIARFGITASRATMPTAHEHEKRRSLRRTILLLLPTHFLFSVLVPGLANGVKVPAIITKIMAWSARRSRSLQRLG